MTTSDLLRPSNPWAGPIAGAFVGGLMAVIFGIFQTNYASQINATATAQADTIHQAQIELREHDQEISELKASDQARKAQDDRTSKAISDIQANEGTMSGEIINTRNGTDEANRRLDTLQKSFDSLLDRIKPDRGH
jgi:septal ring factor EnvC (AmiA/AmiB activator)